MRHRSLFVYIFCLALFCAGCVAPARGTSDSPPSQEVVVFAAASLTEVFTGIGAAFTQSQPQATVTFNFAGSQQLANQLAEGAPASVFASADQRQMDAVVASGRVDPASVALFACNRLVVVAAGERVTALTDLVKPGVKLVIGADAVPVGAYTQAFLAAAGADPAYGEPFRAGVLANVVSYEQSVRAVLSKVRLGEADAGIVYATDAQAASGTTAASTAASTAADVAVFEIPAHLNQLAHYQIAPLGDGSAPKMARRFIDFLLSPEGEKLLTAAGFSTDCAAATSQ